MHKGPPPTHQFVKIRRVQSLSVTTVRQQRHLSLFLAFNSGWWERSRSSKLHWIAENTSMWRWLGNLLHSYDVCSNTTASQRQQYCTSSHSSRMAAAPSNVPLNTQRIISHGSSSNQLLCSYTMNKKCTRAHTTMRFHKKKTIKSA